MLLNILGRVQKLKYELEGAYLKYKILGIRLHPKKFFELQSCVIAHNIFGTDIDTLAGYKVFLDHRGMDENDEPQIVLELPK